MAAAPQSAARQEKAPEPETPRPSFAELEREAFMKGYAQGERAGAEAAAKRGEATLRRLAQTVEELAGLRTELVQKTERQVVELALAIAGRVLRREVTLDRELLVAMARIALERLGENVSATIRLNPDDYAFIGAKAQVGESSLVRVVADPLVSSGGCLVQSDFGFDRRRHRRAARRDGLGSWRDASAGRRGARACRTRRGMSGIALDRYMEKIAQSEPAPLMGEVIRVTGLLVESMGPRVRVGEVCELRGPDGAPPLPVEVVGFRDGRLLTVPLGDTAGIRPGDRIVARGGTLSIPVGVRLMGRVIDGLGRPIDGLGPLQVSESAPLKPAALNPLARSPISEPIGTGVRAMDALLTCGRGQRIGLFGGSGVGKSTLLGMMARGTEADVVVLALVGERGREVRSFLEHDLGPQGLERSVVVVSTSDSPPLLRLRAAYSATAIAEHFRAAGRNVLLDDGLGHPFRHGAA
ncbi:MAG: FliH/SctL family protein [Vicinamibacterales bacterium]